MSSGIYRRHMPATTDPDCLFCKIVAGEIPSQKVDEDADPEQVRLSAGVGPSRGRASRGPAS